jgi:hypothetical protein
MSDHQRSSVARTSIARTIFAAGLLALAVLAAVPGSGSGQSLGTIYILEPLEWRDNKIVVRQPGRPILVSGLADHPSGVLRVLINGEEATLRPDPEDPRIFRFEKVLTVTEAGREVTITIVPRSAEQFSRKFGIDTGTPVRQDSAIARPVSTNPPVTSPTTNPPSSGVGRLYNPTAVAVRSLLVPGLGQFQTRRPALGAAFALGAGGALAAGLMSQRVTVECLVRTTDGSCPAGQSRDELTERPMLLPGLAAFVALGVISAFEASSAARRANARAGSGGDPGDVDVRLAPGFEPGSDGSMKVRVLQVRF